MLSCHRNAQNAEELSLRGTESLEEDESDAEEVCLERLCRVVQLHYRRLFLLQESSDEIASDDIPLIDDVAPLSTLTEMYLSEGMPRPFLEQIDGLIDDGYDRIRFTRGM